MPNKDKVICNNCNKEFLKNKSEIKRSAKLKRQHYCSLKCSGHKNYQHLSLAGNIKNLIPDNLRDEFTPYKYFYMLAKRRDPNSILMLEDIKTIWKRQKGRCILSGIEMNLPLSTRGFEKSFHPYNASLDRINSSIGYTKDNVRFICLMANLAKNKWNDDDLINFAQAIVNYQ